MLVETRPLILLLVALLLWRGLGATQIQAATGLPASLVSAIQVNQLDLSPAIAIHDSSTQDYGGRTQGDSHPAPILGFGGDGKPYLAWNSFDGRHYSEHADGHVTGLATHLKGIDGEIISVPNQRIEDMVVHTDGFALLLAEYTERHEQDNYSIHFHSLYLARYDQQGHQIFKAKIVGIPGITAIGDQAWDGRGAQLAWSGTQYAVYAGTYKMHPDGVIHQGDLLALLDAQGRRLPGGWTWGVSHSFRQRITFDGRQFVTATVGDAHPRGLTIGNCPHFRDKNIFPASGNRGDNYVPITMGAMVSVAEGTILGFDAREGRSSYDIGFVHVDREGKVSPVHWVTNTPQVQERLPRLARYGDNLLIAWATFEGGRRSWSNYLDTDCVAAIVDPAGKILLGPERLPAAWRAPTRFVNFPDGAVGWVSDVQFWFQGSKAIPHLRHFLHVVRVAGPQ